MIDEEKLLKYLDERIKEAKNGLIISKDYSTHQIIFQERFTNYRLLQLLIEAKQFDKRIWRLGINE